MYATRLGTGSGVEPDEGRAGPVRRRFDYAVVRAAREPYAPPVSAAPRARGASGGRPRGRSWRRIARSAGLAAVVLVAVALAASRSVEGSAPPGAQTVVVQRGDTIWSVASRHYPDSDPRTRVEQIERLNHLDGPVVRPGDRLQLPED